jgi:hypothetical protein
MSFWKKAFAKLKKVGEFAGKAKKWAKKTRIMSKVLNVVKDMHPMLGKAHSMADAYGYGRRRMIRRGGSRRGTNTLTGPLRRIAYSNIPFSIPKLSVDVYRRNNPLGLGANYR